eukprot:scaffold22825_cov63-Phaeocystis_antarctica.AAC.2
MPRSARPACTRACNCEYRVLSSSSKPVSTSTTIFASWSELDERLVRANSVAGLAFEEGGKWGTLFRGTPPALRAAAGEQRGREPGALRVGARPEPARPVDRAPQRQAARPRRDGCPLSAARRRSPECAARRGRARRPDPHQPW